MTTFSAIVCTKGRPESVDRALAALAATDPAPDEVIVVDGDETQSARPVAERHGVRYLASPPGLTRQRNNGIAMATGDVVAFFDDDARPAPDVFKHLAAAYAEPDVVGATGRIDEPGDHAVGGRGSLMRRLVTGRGRPGTFTKGGYPRRYTTLDDADIEFMQGAFLTARRGLAAELEFDEALAGYGLAEDEDFSCRLSRRGRIRFVKAAVVEHDNTGFGTRDSRVFNRQLVVNRSYLFAKNFERTKRARASFAWMLAVLVAHRVVNRDWAGVRGLFDGMAAARRHVRPSAPPTVPVTFVSSHAKLGGSEHYLERLLDGLGPEWVHAVVALEDGPFVRRAGHHVRVVPTTSSWLSILAAARQLRLMRPELVHANGVKAAVVAVLARVPTVWVKHDHSYDGRIGRLVARRCRAVIGVSQAVLDGIGNPSNGRVVPTGVPIPTVDKAAAHQTVVELAHGEPVIALVGRLHPVKGHRDLLAAAPPGTRLLFVGPDDSSTPDYADALRQEAAGRATFLGWHDDITGILAGADVIAIPSENEGFGLVAAEAMAAATPVVGYAVGALPELVGDCGVLVPPGDVDALRQALAEPPSGDCGPDRVRRLFPVDAWLETMRDTYRASRTI